MGRQACLTSCFERHSLTSHSMTNPKSPFTPISLGPLFLAGIIVHAALADVAVDARFNPGASGPVYALALQTDGKILVGGSFTTLAGFPCEFISRLNVNGRVDTNLNAGSGSGSLPYWVSAIAVEADGRFLVAGRFTKLGGTAHNSIGRFNTDGSLDASFRPAVNSLVYSLAVQPDAKILVGGQFTSLAGQSRTNIGRLYSDGTVEAAFDPGADGVVNCLALQENGKILVGGQFTILGGQSRTSIGRLNVDGSLDTSFNSRVDGIVNCLLLQPDAKILVGGQFTTLGGQSCTNIGRLNPDGSLDTSFNSGANKEVNCIVLQADRKILVGGRLKWLSGQSRTNIGRLNPDGSLDTTFDLGASLDSYPNVYSLALQTDGKILVGGYFQTLGGILKSNIGRLNNTEPATQTLAFIDSTVTWMRGGTSPEVYRTTFEASVDGGVQWKPLGDGVRIAGGWQLSTADVPPNATIRARGHAAGGYHNGSSSIVEAFVGPVAILRQPLSRTNNARTSASFAVQTWDGGLGTNWYQWRRDGTNLIDGGNTTGAQSAALILTDVLKADEGGYSVVVSNLSGYATSVAAWLSVVDPVILKEPIGPAQNIGESATLTVSAVGTPPLTYQWWKDGIVLTERTNNSLTLTNLNPGDVGYYCVAISNKWGSIASARVPLVVNSVFRDSIFNSGANSNVLALATQADGMILAGGQFTRLSGQPCTNLGRLNADGRLDTSFNPRVIGSVNCLAVPPDGRVVVGGDFIMPGEQPRTNLARLNRNGSPDISFSPTVNGVVHSLSFEADGRLLLGGEFTRLGSLTRNYIARLNVDGSIDSSFNPGSNGRVICLATQADGRILVGGWFTTLGGQTRRSVGRLYPDGSLDASFNSDVKDHVDCLVVQPDGRIILGGYFTGMGGQLHASILRLNSDGSVDNAFSPGIGDYVYSLAAQTDGKLLVGGSFTRLAGQTLNRLGRLNADGSVDNTFNPGADDQVSSLLLQSDGGILVGGQFKILGGQECNRIGRLNNTAAARQSLLFDGSTVTWLRDSTSTEVLRTAFEASTNGGAEWLHLGNGSRFQAGWRLSGLSLPTNATIRARGHTIGGYHNGSSWFVESFVGPVAISSQPLSQTNNPGTTASFTVQAWEGSGATNYYQWRKDGIDLVDGGNIAGAQSSTLMITNVLGADQGGYTVVFGSNSGSLTSLVARLSVEDPMILAQPIGLERNVGESATLILAASGTPPLKYQWIKNGTPLEDETSSSLIFTNLGAADAGYYWATVSNEWGCVTSATACLAVNATTPDSGFNVGVDGSVSSVVLQPDGKVLLGGTFRTINGQRCTNIARVNTDGRLDTGFHSGADGYVNHILVQPDGQILVGGSFRTLAGELRANLGRLYADGSVDPVWTCSASSEVSCLASQADGKILVGGTFSLLGGVSCRYLGRVDQDGELDSGFKPALNGVVRCLALQADGKVLVGGQFTTVQGQPCTNICRLHVDGSLDSSFNPAANDYVDSIAVQADGKILVGGRFTTVGGQARNSIGRLNTDGSLDSPFNPGANGIVSVLAVQADGKVLVGGEFTILGGLQRANLGRINSDGNLDNTFNPGANGGVSSLLLQGDGDILVGGEFTLLAGQPCSHLGRLNNTRPAMENLSFDGSTITWLRGGTSTEVVRTTFEASTNGGTQWMNLGDASRSPEGWQLGGLNLPANSTIRVRGFQSQASWFVESFAGPFAISSQPCSRVNKASTTASFVIQAWDGSAGTNMYQWRKDATNLVNGNSITGARNATLVLSNVLRAETGGYSVVISNLSGSITSTVAQLSVVDPAILIEPTDLGRNLGSTATLTVVAGGTPPLGYQWFKDGVALNDQTNSSLTMTDLKTSDGGRYSVAVTNRWGSVTSTVVYVIVNVVTADTSFSGEADQTVQCLAVQPDGKIVVGGNFTILDGLRNHIERLNLDGSLDTAFDPGASGNVCSLVMQANGKILVGGEFQALCKQARNYIGRLNPDGSLDTEFNPNASWSVYSLAVQTDKKILVGGDFKTLDGQACNNIGRLNEDGSLDASFNSGANWSVYSVAAQPDGKILVGGRFTMLGGQTRLSLGRLHADGRLDESFDPGADQAVRSLVVQPDGKILVGGQFTILGGQPRNYIGRLNADGSLDTSFDPGASWSVYSLVVQPDGMILVGGLFSTLGGEPRSRIGRLHPDGTLDATFNPGADSLVYCMALQPDSKILVGGWLTRLAGQPCNHLGRLNSTGGPLLPRIASPTSVLAFSNNAFSFNFSGVAGSYVVIEGSVNLESWIPMRTNFLNTSVSTFRDPEVTNSPTRYYRVRVQ